MAVRLSLTARRLVSWLAAVTLVAKPIVWLALNVPQMPVGLVYWPVWLALSPQVSVSDFCRSKPSWSSVVSALVSSTSVCCSDSFCSSRVSSRLV